MTKRLAKRDDDAIRVRSLIRPLVLVAIAAKLIQLGATRGGVGPFEYVTLADLIVLLLLTAFRLSRRALGCA